MPVKIGFIGSSAPSSPHHDSFRRFIPKDLEFTFVQEAGAKTSLYDARGKVDALVGQVQELIAEQRWDGVIISGAPKEALNPGMWERVSAGLKVPVSLALRSSVAALKARSAAGSALAAIAAASRSCGSSWSRELASARRRASCSSRRSRRSGRAIGRRCRS